jgi:acetoin utilization protein AcuB
MTLRQRRRAMPRIADFMTPIPHCIRSDETLAVARARMKAHGIRHLPVLDPDGLAGLLSERDLDIIEKCRDVAPERVAVHEAMMPVVYTASIDAPLDEIAADMSERHYGSAVIVDKGRVVGIFTTTDALRALKALLANIPRG